MFPPGRDTQLTHYSSRDAAYHGRAQQELKRYSGADQSTCPNCNVLALEKSAAGETERERGRERERTPSMKKVADGSGSGHQDFTSHNTGCTVLLFSRYLQLYGGDTKTIGCQFPMNGLYSYVRHTGTCRMGNNPFQAHKLRWQSF